MSKINFYTEEIKRCCSFMVGQIRKGLKIEDIMTQAIGSYGFAIANSSRNAIIRNLNN